MKLVSADLSTTPETTPPDQMRTLKLLLRKLWEAGYHGEVQSNVGYPIWRGTTRVIQRKGTLRHRYPDICIPGAFLVVEVDGTVHDNLEQKIRRDQTREHEWKNTYNFDVYRISRDQAEDDIQLAKCVNEIVALVLERRASPAHRKALGRIRVRLHRLLRLFKQRCPEKISLHPIEGNVRKKKPRMRRRTGLPQPHRRRGGLTYFLTAGTEGGRESPP